MNTRETRTPRNRSTGARRTTDASTTGAPTTELATAAAIFPNTFRELNVNDAVPRSWVDRARKAVEYYQEEPLVANAINAWRTFALGDEISLACDDRRVLDEAQDAFWRLNLNRFVKDMVLQLLIKGDAIGYILPAVGGTDIAKVICVNPVSVELKFEGDELAQAIQRPQNANGSFGEEIDLDLDLMLHVKWNAPEFEARGISMILPAFESIELLHDYRRAERAIAKRWATPLRFIRVGGVFGGHTIMPDQKALDRIREELHRMDMKQGLVVPFWVDAETYGAEAAVLNTEAKVREVKEDILVALGMARSVVAGEGPNYATASVAMQKMIVQLKEIKQVARDILDWVFDNWLERKGWEDKLLHYTFNDLDLTAEVDQKKLLVELYDRGLISKKSLQQKMGLSPAVESHERAGEAVTVDTNWSVQDISQLLALGVLTVDEARDRLKLVEPAEKAHAAAALRDIEKLYARTNLRLLSPDEPKKS